MNFIGRSDRSLRHLLFSVNMDVAYNMANFMGELGFAFLIEVELVFCVVLVFVVVMWQQVASRARSANTAEKTITAGGNALKCYMPSNPNHAKEIYSLTFISYENIMQ